MVFQIFIACYKLHQGYISKKENHPCKLEILENYTLHIAEYNPFNVSMSWNICFINTI